MSERFVLNEYHTMNEVWWQVWDSFYRVTLVKHKVKGKVEKMVGDCNAAIENTPSLREASPRKIREEVLA